MSFFEHGTMDKILNVRQNTSTMVQSIGEQVMAFKIGDSVVVKSGVDDPDFGRDIGIIAELATFLVIIMRKLNCPLYRFA